MKKTTVFLLFLVACITGIFAQPVLKPASSVNEYSLIYELFGGTNAPENKDSYEENATVTLEVPTRSGYRFDGWYWDEALKEPLPENTFSSKKGALKVYAKWLKEMDFASFESENMVEIIPVDNKVTLEDFSGTEGPQDIFAYAISKYEVTQELYQAVTGSNPSYYKGEKNPVENITLYDAVNFCNELTKITMGEDNCCYTITNISKNSDGNIIRATVTWDQSKKGYRLPTEAEWEMAARGGVNGGWDYSYSGSDNVSEVAWYYWNTSRNPNPVGTKLANMAGLYDMSGNVYELCWSEDLNPCYRGGSYYSESNLCTVTSWNRTYSSSCDSTIGFRVCQSLESRTAPWFQPPNRYKNMDR